MKDGQVEAKYLIQLADLNITNKTGADLLAVLIYGLMIFPRTVGYVHPAVVTFLKEVKHGADPSVAILAETIRSLNYCRSQNGRFQGSAHMLTVWFKSNFGFVKKEGLCFLWRDREPIAVYNRNKWPPRQPEGAWIDWFKDLKDSQIMWKARWMPMKDTPYISVEIPWIPLVGIWGTISYSPLLVRRQLGSKQFIPLTHGLDSVDFPHKTEGQFKEAAKHGSDYKGAHKMSHAIYMKMSYLSIQNGTAIG